MDLTKSYPRSVRDKWQGIYQLGRAVDKAKAKASGNIGEYSYDCPMDKAIFEFLGIDGNELLEVARSAKSEAEIEAFTKPYVDAKTPEEVERWNNEWLNYGPSDHTREYFLNLRNSLDPDRTDITTWADLLDLDEKREVPRRSPAATL
jgi:hypothetical protein